MNNKEGVWGKGESLPYACASYFGGAHVSLGSYCELWVVIDAGYDVYEGLVDAKTLDVSSACGCILSEAFSQSRKSE